MVCPFVEDPIDEEATSVHRVISIGGCVLSLPDDDTLQCRFFSQSIIDLHNLIRPQITDITQLVIYLGLII